jgi:hypothetical protein
MFPLEKFYRLVKYLYVWVVTYPYGEANENSPQAPKNTLYSNLFCSIVSDEEIFQDCHLESGLNVGGGVVVCGWCLISECPT